MTCSGRNLLPSPYYWNGAQHHFQDNVFHSTQFLHQDTGYLETATFPSIMHFTLKVDAAKSSKTWYPVMTLHGITTQKTTEHHGMS